MVTALLSLPPGNGPQIVTPGRTQFKTCPDTAHVCGFAEPCTTCESYTGTQTCPEGQHGVRAANDVSQESICTLTSYGLSDLADGNVNYTVSTNTLIDGFGYPGIHSMSCPVPPYYIQFQSATCDYVPNTTFGGTFQRHTVNFKMYGAVGSSAQIFPDGGATVCSRRAGTDPECLPGDDCLVCEGWHGNIPGKCPTGISAARAADDPPEANCTFYSYRNGTANLSAGTHNMLIQALPHIRISDVGPITCPPVPAQVQAASRRLESFGQRREDRIQVLVKPEPYF